MQARSLSVFLRHTLPSGFLSQLYFVDDSLRPVGTVRIVDILKLLLRED
jgi:hypothetical protein